MTWPRFIGIDPGATGAFAVLDGPQGELIHVEDFPVHDGKISPQLLTVALDFHNELGVRAVLEMPGPMPQQGVSSTWKFARTVGLIEGVLAGLGIQTVTVTPAKWKRLMGLSKDKGHSRAMAAQLWPDKASWFMRVKDDGRAEAALLAELGRRTL